MFFFLMLTNVLLKLFVGDDLCFCNYDKRGLYSIMSGYKLVMLNESLISSSSGDGWTN